MTPRPTPTPAPAPDLTGPPRRPSRVDLLLVLALLVAGQVEVWLQLGSMIASGGTQVGSAIAATIAASAFVFRRTAPVICAALIVTAAALMATGISEVLFWGGFWPFLVASYSGARYGGRRATALGATYALMILGLDLAVEEMRAPGQIIFHWIALIAAWVIGRTAERHVRLEARAAARADELAATQHLRERAVVVAERERIARELHDIVAHAVSVMIVQAGAAEHVLDENPAAARTALRAVQEHGRSAMTEMRSMVGVLRHATDLESVDATPTQAEPREPQPSLDRLPALIDEARSAGLDVTLSVEGEQVDLPAGLELATYRIVQEALTNVRRHAATRTARVTVQYARDAITLRVDDDGSNAPPLTKHASSPADGSGGHGIVGMRERVGLYGGRLTTGPRADGTGFRVEASMPITGSA